ncbi:Uncharacterised protein [uncultured archaeon]|nr:Uncharacterised protein [uncultured archaeon]
MKKPSKTDAGKQIKEFFDDLENKTILDIRKMKKLAMNCNVQLNELRKKFCKRCYFPLWDSKIRIKKGIKTIECKNCGKVNRWKIKTS